MRKFLLEKANTFRKSNKKKIKAAFSLQILSSSRISILLCRMLWVAHRGDIREGGNTLVGRGEEKPFGK